MFRFMEESSSGSQSQCLAKITDMVPAYLFIRFVGSAMEAYSNLYTESHAHCAQVGICRHSTANETYQQIRWNHIHNFS